LQPELYRNIISSRTPKAFASERVRSQLTPDHILQKMKLGKTEPTAAKATRSFHSEE